MQRTVLISSCMVCPRTTSKHRRIALNAYVVSTLNWCDQPMNKAEFQSPQKKIHHREETEGFGGLTETQTEHLESG